MVEGCFEDSQVKWGRRITNINDHYIGEFSENCYHGIGTYYDPEGGVAYGKWQENALIEHLE